MLACKADQIVHGTAPILQLALQVASLCAMWLPFVLAIKDGCSEEVWGLGSLGRSVYERFSFRLPHLVSVSTRFQTYVTQRIVAHNCLSHVSSYVQCRAAIPLQNL